MNIRTKYGNNYYLSLSKKEILVMPLTLSKLIDGDVNALTQDKVELSYYKQKYELLEKAGYFIPKRHIISDRINKELLERAIANSNHIVFETTEACNLQCKYCGYGEIYSTFGKREKHRLSFDKVKILLDFLLEKWNSPLNISFNKRINISFYGGEPLMNFPLIEKTVNYISTCNLKKSRINFSLTTNGILLDNHIDFFTKWDFTLFISIDGNKSHNAFRVHQNGRESFEKVYENITLIKEKYPIYFKNNVFFNSVFHIKSSFIEVTDFFQKHFNKSPQFLWLNTFGVASGKEKEFEKLYKNPVYTLNMEGICHPEIKEQFSSTKEKVLSLFYHFNNDLFAEYNAVRFNIENSILPTGTCIPFQHKIYVSAEGNILPCEKVGFEFIMGKITNAGVTINYEAIANYYNQKFECIIKDLCDKCKNIFCKSCIFTMKNEKGKLYCNKFLNKKEFDNYMSHLIEECEEQPEIVTDILRSIQNK